MKKFLAALLAVVMVVSLFPATVFAATSGECALLEKDHSKANCELAGVEYAKVGATVAPECGQDGYTMYKCECGHYFADDIIPMDPHYTAATKPTTPRVEATCSQYGIAAGFTCDNCGELYYVYEVGDIEATDKDAPAGAIAKLAHDWDSPSYPGADCTASEVVCSICGEKKTDHKPVKEHNFDYTDIFAVVKVPGTCEPGVATFKCTNEGCEVTKDVAIDLTGHDKEDLKYVKAKAGTCSKAGIKAYYQCEECDAKFLEQKDGSLKLVTDDSELATAVGHSYGEEPSYIVLPTCTQYGADYYFCELCGYLKIENEVSPIGHTTYEEAVAHDADKDKVKKDGKWITKVEAVACTDQTTYTWSCHKECYCEAVENDEDPTQAEKSVCGYTGTLTTKKEAAKGHTKVTISVPATVKYVGYTITVCTNKDCDAAALDEFESVKVSSKTYSVPVYVKVVDGDVYEMTETDKIGYHPIEVKGSKAAIKTCGAHFYELDDDAVNKPATCTEKGYDIYFCSTCNEETILEVAKLGHNYDLEAVADADWECEASTKVPCVNGCGSTKTYKNGLGHKYDDEFDYEVKVPTCEESAGKYYYCLICGEVKIEDEVKFEYSPYFYTMKEALAAHPGLDVLNPNKEVEGSCTKKGHIEFACDDCGDIIWVFDETTGKHLPPEGTPEYKDTTCAHGKGLAAYKCARCGKSVAAENEPLEHILTKVPAKKPTCTADGNVEYYTCSRDCCQVDVDPSSKKDMQPIKYKQIENLDEDEEIYYTYEAFDDDSWKLPKLGHDYDATTTTVAPTCTTAGYTHKICANGCGTESVYDVVKATGHSKGAASNVAATCVTAGRKESYLCKNANCAGPDKKFDTADDGFHTYKEVPATGHKNKAGETIENKCTSTVTDRVCVACNKTSGCLDVDCLNELEYNTKTKKYEVKKECALYERTVVPTCEQYGYTLEICANGCGYEAVKATVKPLGHQGVWGARAVEGYVNAADIEAIGDMFLNNKKDFIATYGKDAITAYTPATYENKGSVTFKCADCKKEITLDVLKIGVDFTLNVDNAAKAGASYTYNADGEINGINIIDGDVIAVDINMSAFETKVWGFNLDVEYQAASMKFLGYKFNDVEKFTNFNVNNVLEDMYYYEDVNGDGFDEMTYIAEDVIGTVKISAYTENAIDGTMVDAIVTGTEKVVTLYFQIEDVYEYSYAGVKYVDFNNYIFVELDNISVINTEDEVEAYGDIFNNYVYGMMDSNLNNNFNITDVQNCVKVIKGQADVEYLASCDVNSDGVVNLTDLDLMNKYLVGAVDVYDIYAALNWAAPEGFVAG